MNNAGFIDDTTSINKKRTAKLIAIRIYFISSKD